jgi:hypothetical protein
MTKNKEISYEFYVAGMKFHQYPRVKPFIKEGDEVLLIPDPENKYDPHAVRILIVLDHELIMLGHVPMKKDLSMKISKLIKETNQDIGIVTYHGLESPSYQALKIKVSFNVS